jgi:hypothetical protein
VVLTTHSLLAPRSRKSRAIPLPPSLWAFGPVTGYLYLYFTKTSEIENVGTSTGIEIEDKNGLLTSLHSEIHIY